MAAYPKDVFELVLQDMHGETPDQQNPEVQTIRKYIDCARLYFSKNQPVAQRMSIESSLVLQLQDNQVIPFCDIPMEETGAFNGSMGITNPQARSSESTRSPSWNVTG